MQCLYWVLLNRCCIFMYTVYIQSKKNGFFEIIYRKNKSNIYVILTNKRLFANDIWLGNIFLSLENLSFQKTATQSHTFTGPSYNASNAVDGNMATCMRTYPIGRNSPDKTVWWKVDLGGVSNIYSISIFFRNYDASLGVYFYENY